MKTLAYAADNAKAPLKKATIERREPGPRDVQIEILYCGICHSDIHTVRSEWEGTIFPCVPGHEIVGKVTQVGSQVKKFKVGDYAAVGCLVDSCRSCSSCKADQEQYCEVGMVFTYNSPDKHSGKQTLGGYSKQIVVDEDFVLKVPKAFSEKDLPGVAPLLCAGITMYSPLRHWGVKKGSVVGVVGLGGLGHMAIKIAKALGAKVTLFTTSPGKAEDAKRLGAEEVVISKDPKAMEAHQNKFDFIINSVAAAHDLNPFLNLLKRDGTMCLVGAPEHPHPPLDVRTVIFKRRSLAGSLIGGIKETQEMLDFCAEHHLLSDIELIPIDYVNEAYDRVVKGDVKYRFVIDLATLK